MKSVRICLVILFSACVLLFSACKKGIDENKTTPIVKNKLSGYVQKGPFINGTSIQMFELNSSLDQTGKIFNTQILDYKGSFEIDNVVLSSQYVEFLANGFYFNEILGTISVAPLTLYALSDITDLTSVNVNLLTHLEKSRVEYLVGKGMSFSVAKDSAQAEIMSIFGFKNNTMDQSEKLDISVNKEENAILLAISIILQGNRSVGDLTELLANISTDIKTDGKLNDSSINSKLRDSTLITNLPKIRSNLEKRYQELGINVTIPEFEKYINDYFAFTGQNIPGVITQAATNSDTAMVTLNGLVKANYLSSDVTFEYGPTDSYGFTASAPQSPVTGNKYTAVSANLTGLKPGTIYHFRVKSVNSLGTTYGSDLIFTTLGEAPVATTQEASDILATTSTLNGNVNANHLSTSVTFEYGTTTSYGSIATAIQSPVIGITAIKVTKPLTGLSENTTYHYRIIATNSLGTTYGDDMSFKTSKLTSTLAASNIEPTSVTLNGIIDANISFTDVSFEYGTSLSYGSTISAIQNPVTGSLITRVNASVTGLINETTYHFRLVAIYSGGTIYGDDFTFKTAPTSVSDIDGNIYKIISIGTQVWMTENLKVTHYSDGTAIKNLTDDSQWAANSDGAYCWYNNDITYSNPYGAMYNWYAVTNSLNICPSGWHVPAFSEWESLATYLGGDSIAGGKMIETGPTYWQNWQSPNEATNESGFSGLPGGYRGQTGIFNVLGYGAYYWSSTEYNTIDAYHIGLGCVNKTISIWYFYKNAGFSVRCLKDN